MQKGLVPVHEQQQQPLMVDNGEPRHADRHQPGHLFMQHGMHTWNAAKLSVARCTIRMQAFHWSLGATLVSMLLHTAGGALQQRTRTRAAGAH